ncbi:hypothetical protein DIPPA_08221 [Diplonema papillatum]|nr:hypothetical protein DIPPA_08221 [Diplonema papillatum]|eukprot:gene22609-34598_t
MSSLLTDFFGLDGWTVSTVKTSTTDGWALLPQANSESSDKVWVESWFKYGGLQTKSIVRQNTADSSTEMEYGGVVWPLVKPETKTTSVPPLVDRAWVKVLAPYSNVAASQVSLGYNQKNPSWRSDWKVLASIFPGAPTVTYNHTLYAGDDHDVPTNNAHIAVSTDLLAAQGQSNVSLATTFTLGQLHRLLAPNPVTPAAVDNVKCTVAHARTCGASNDGSSLAKTVVASVEKPFFVLQYPVTLGAMHATRTEDMTDPKGVVHRTVAPASFSVAAAIQATPTLMAKVKRDITSRATSLALIQTGLPGGWQAIASATHMADNSEPTFGLMLTQAC